MSAAQNMNIRLKEEERARWLAAASAEGRTLTGLVKWAVELYLTRRHPAISADGLRDVYVRQAERIPTESAEGISIPCPSCGGSLVWSGDYLVHAAGPAAPLVAYPLCRTCGHRHDAHRDAGDPRGPGCWECPCPGYEPATDGELVVDTDPDDDEGDDVEPGTGE